MGRESPVEGSEGRSDAVTATKTKTDVSSSVEARQQLEAAEIHLEELTNRLERGDFSVRQSDLSQAENRVRYLERVVTGAEVADQRRQGEERDDAGKRLYQEFLTGAEKAVREADQALQDVGRTVAVALDALDQIDDLRHGFQSRWNGLFRGHTEEPAALAFKFNGNPSGSFGAITEGRVLPRMNSIETIEAVIAESVRGRKNMSGPDAAWWSKLKAPQIASGLRDIRNLVQYFSEDETG